MAANGKLLGCYGHRSLRLCVMEESETSCNDIRGVRCEPSHLRCRLHNCLPFAWLRHRKREPVHGKIDEWGAHVSCATVVKHLLKIHMSERVGRRPHQHLGSHCADGGG